MSIYRTLLTTAFACAIASPVLANDTATQAASVVVASARKVTQVAPAANAKVNINQAKAKELLNVKGINPSIARAIVSYRKKHGEFKSLNDLAKVRVLKKMNADELKVIQDQLSV